MPPGRHLELQTLIRLSEDLALFRAEMAGWPGTGELANHGHRHTPRDQGPGSLARTEPHAGVKAIGGFGVSRASPTRSP